MKRNRNGAKRRQQTIQVWTYDQAKRVLPYLASIVNSLREHKLEAQRQQLIVERLDSKPGRPNRDMILERQEAAIAGRVAQDHFDEALEELHTLDVYCMDAIQGLALIPFAQQDQLAWLIFNLFERDSLKSWRFHEDPLETRRPIETMASVK